MHNRSFPNDRTATMLNIDLDQFAAALDIAIRAHLDWSRRVLRCAVLKTTPGDDVLADNAHFLCQFGHLYAAHRQAFFEMDPERAAILEKDHMLLHDSSRAICLSILAGSVGKAEDLDVFESAQHRLIENLAYFITLVMSRNSHVDPLTGLPLRHDMQRDFEALRRQSKRRGTIQLLMMVDVDHFKRVNDEHGHAGGDVVLQRIAEALKLALRSEDFIYRFGGEEFVLLMESNATASAAANAAQRVLGAIQGLSIRLGENAVVRPTVTIGVAQAASDETLPDLIERADKAMYEGKASGRNRYVIA
jgi:diguanylate cyclase (GGDEF)-like protein